MKEAAAIEAEFWTRVDKSGDCWLWTGHIQKEGYPVFTIVHGVTTLAHRFSYKLKNGAIPKGIVIDHECHNNSGCEGGYCLHRRCVNPSHLVAKTSTENVNASHLSNKNKTHCKHGHEYTDENTYRNKRGYRACRKCNLAEGRKHRSNMRRLKENS